MQVVSCPALSRGMAEYMEDAIHIQLGKMWQRDLFVEDCDQTPVAQHSKSFSSKSTDSVGI